MLFNLLKIAQVIRMISWRYESGIGCLRIQYVLKTSWKPQARFDKVSTDEPIDVQLHLRIMKYVMSNLKSTNSLVRLSTQLCMSGSKSFTCKSINHIMSIYGLSKFQVNNYDSLITIKNKTINVSDSNVKDESRKAAGNIIYLMTMREHCDNCEFSHDELNDMLNMFVQNDFYIDTWHQINLTLLIHFLFTIV